MIECFPSLNMYLKLCACVSHSDAEDGTLWSSFLIKLFFLVDCSSVRCGANKIHLYCAGIVKF